MVRQAILAAHYQRYILPVAFSFLRLGGLSCLSPEQKHLSVSGLCAAAAQWRPRCWRLFPRASSSRRSPGGGAGGLADDLYGRFRLRWWPTPLTSRWADYWVAMASWTSQGQHVWVLSPFRFPSELSFVVPTGRCVLTFWVDSKLRTAGLCAGVELVWAFVLFSSMLLRLFWLVVSSRNHWKWQVFVCLGETLFWRHSCGEIDRICWNYSGYCVVLTFPFA